ncbi:hypothetical protein BDF20DRAFT_883078 [Mycotypha africana]|uniref:uncharacterized protein n=1 Tax=Mycotypha africana TaxID=64632 RepID=UPI002301D33F|nr:uncharacterized protein BDF20DRAFT_903446 [Mycotypha africana]XP_052934226.1 uncharacterized protein BDF20DRAFT_883078 [Mycotypha africana]KAI8966963.1 hypothetical protein BDF20DRAFT_903446 [Mycotypha africana]KAI8973564.1 hypothetical protein BDF20DRAFT_883078 [Mycotypha africana]
MYKSFIIQKIRSIKEKHKNQVKTNPFDHTKCRDSYEPGHFDKRYYKCKYYKAVNADDGKQ